MQFSAICFLILGQTIWAAVPEAFSNDGVFSAWMQTNGTKYKLSTFVNTTSGKDGIGLFWNVDQQSKTIQLAVACPIGKGWCGFGISEAGAMKGADMVIYETESKTIYDAHVLDDINAGPVRDECQNWVFDGSTVSEEVIIFECSRDLDTQDSFDRALIDDSDTAIPATRVIAAWGESSSVTYHGQNVARTSVRFFSNSTLSVQKEFDDIMDKQAEGSFVLRASNYTVPEAATFYAHFCYTYNDLVALGVPMDEDLHIIGVEPEVAIETTQYVHHFVLSGSPETNENETLPIAMEYCNRNLSITEVAYVWAPGEEPFVYPSYLGGPLGKTGFRSFKLEVHYNNPTNASNLVDNSGVRLFWTTKKRQHDLGVLQLGDPLISLFGQNVGKGVTKHTFDCPSSCSAVSVSTPVTVVREYLHMHKAGMFAYNKQVRDGSVVRAGHAEFYDFAQQGNQAVQQQEFQILPGDSFSTQCVYNGNDEVWGLGSHEEMCMSFLLYYPRQVVDETSGFTYTCGLGFQDIFPQCDSTHNTSNVESARMLERSFGGANGICKVVNNSSTSKPTTTSGATKPAMYYGIVLTFIYLLM